MTVRRKRSKKLQILLAFVALLAISASIISYLLFTPREAKAEWYDGGWPYRKKLSINHNKVNGPLTDFPVLVSLTDTGFQTHAQEDGDDFLFTLNDGATQLDHEIEDYDPATGTLTAWVKIPNLSSEEDTPIYIYYGNQVTDSQQNSAAVWSNNFTSVWHLNQDPTQSCASSREYCDSTSNNNADAQSMDINDRVVGKIAKAANFDGINNYISTNTSYNNPQNITISAWVKTTSSSGNKVVGFEKNQTGNTSSQYDRQIYIDTGGKARVGSYDGSADTVQSSASVNNGTWHYIVGTIDNDNNLLTLFVDGSAPQTASNNNAENFTGYWRIGSYRMTGWPSSNQGFFDGQIDEVRISSIVRSEDWVITSFNNQNDPQGFFTFNSTDEWMPTVLNWKLDEGYGSNAYDSLEHRLDAVLGNASHYPEWSSSDDCALSKCLRFDGIDDYVTKTYDSSTDTALDPGNASFAVSLWFRTSSSVTAQQNLLTRYKNAGYQVYMNSSGQVCATIADSSHNLSAGDNICSTNTYANSRWHFLKFIFDPDAEQKLALYVDGNIVSSSSVLTNTGSLSGNSPAIYVGIADDGTSSPWSGWIDNIKIFREANDIEKMKADQSSFNSDDGASVILGANDPLDTISNGLVGYWKFNETSGNAVDKSGNSQTLTNINTVLFGLGKFGGGAIFDSSSQQYFYTADSAPLSVSDNLTITAWFKPAVTTSDTQYNIAAKWDGANKSYLLAQYGPQLRFYVNSDNDYIETTSADLQTDTLYHVAVVYSTKSQQPKIYLNGDWISSTSHGNIGYDLINDNTGRFHVGAQDSSSTPSNFYNGMIDEVRVYNRALSGTLIQRFYDWSPDPISQWSMDEGSGASVKNQGSSNTGLSLTCSGAGCSDPSWTIGKYGKAVKFDDTDNSYAEIDSQSLTVDTTRAFSVAFWAYFDDLESGIDENILSDDQGDRFAIYIRGNSSTTGRVYVCADANGCSNNSLSNNSIVTEQKWQHFVITYDGSGSYSIYVDGIDQTSDATSGAQDTSSNNFYIGIYKPTGVKDGTNGSFDEFKVFNYALSHKKVVSDMNKDHPLVGGSVGSAVAYWNFDEGTDTTAYSSGNCKTPCYGSLNGFIDPPNSTSGWTSQGKYSNALNFDGNDNYVNIGNDYQLRIPEKISISTWVKPGASSGSIISKWDEGNSRKSYLLYLNSSNQIEFSVSTDGATESTVTSNDSLLSDGSTWYHIVGVYNGSQMRLYINADQNGSLVKTGKLYEGSTNVTIGASYSNGSRTKYFNGTIDEVRIFAFPLTEEEINQEYFSGSSALLGTISTSSDGLTPDDSHDRAYCVPGDTQTCRAPKGDWSFEDKSGTRAVDKSGVGNHGTLTGNVKPEWGRGINNGAIIFYNNNSSYVSIQNESTYDFTSAFTLQAWVKVNSFQNATSEFLSKNGVWGFNAISSNYLNFDTNGLSNVTLQSNSQITDNIWHFITAVWDGATKYIFIDGQLDTSANATGTLSTNNSTFRIGDDSNTGSNYFDASVDDVRIYDYARTIPQINWDMNRGKPFAWWKFDECSSETIMDGTGNGANGTLLIGTSGTQSSSGRCNTGVSTESWNNGSEGKLNSSIYLDGTDDKVSLDNKSSVRNLQQASISVWVYPTAYNTLGSKIYYEPVNSTSANSRFELVLLSDGKVRLQGRAPDSDPLTEWITSEKSVQLNQWSHIVATYDSVNSEHKIYINKDLQTNNLSADGFTDSDPAAVPYIGADSTGSDTYNFNGKIDELKLFSYALTQIQQQLLFNNDSSVFIGPDQGLPD